MATARPKMSELQALPDADLRAQLDGLRQELWQQRIKLHDGALQQTHQLQALRRQIARVQTALRRTQPATP